MNQRSGEGSDNPVGGGGYKEPIDNKKNKGSERAGEAVVNAGLGKKSLGFVLSAFLLLTATSVWAVDTDGDGTQDASSVTQISFKGGVFCALDDAGIRCRAVASATVVN
ncbi:MAG: hypothetical protein R3E67_08990 [Pseudomonadales bacterium]